MDTTLNEMTMAVLRLRRKNAAEGDGIEASVAMNSPEVIEEYLHQNYTYCLAIYFPSLWKSAIICPFLKSGHPLNLPGSFH